MTTDFEGKVVALVGRGGPLDRALAVALAERGADIALGTCERLPQQEFAVASIANEVWAIGRAQFSTVMDSANELDVSAFARDVVTRLGRCDALLVVGHDAMDVAAFGAVLANVRILRVADDGRDVAAIAESTLAQLV
jgi:NAD(P)-dependent dehydrogenase (short-subunit alcohol dehydrogenase family)